MTPLYVVQKIMNGLFYDLYYQKKVREANDDARSAGEKTKSLEEKIDFLSSRCDRLALGCQAMWELLREKHELTDEEIEIKIHEVDLRDGLADGKMSSSLVKCSSCGRNSNSTRPNCIYCGEKIDVTNDVFKI